MTKTEYTLRELTEILSSLSGRQRRPMSRASAIRAIGKLAVEYGRTADDAFAEAKCVLGDKGFPRFVVEWEKPEASVHTQDDALVDKIVQIKTRDDEAAVEDGDPVPTNSIEFENSDRAAANEATWPAPKTRANTKQARLIEMLRRPDGASIDEIAETLAWEKHTVRGVISGALKKKLGLAITSGKIEGRGTVYHLDD